MGLGIKGIVRNKLGKEDALKGRSKGLIPGVIYGKNLKENLHIYLNYLEFEKLLHKVGRNKLFEIELDDGQKYQVFVKDLQIHPTKRTINHVDLQSVEKDEEVVVSVPIEFVGTPKGSRAGGIFRRALWSLKLKVKSTEIPDSVKIDVSNLDIGDTLVIFKIKDKVPYRIMNHENTLVAGVYKG
ncbi:MAG: 50S ribosomal protein L25 [Brevinematales bacterium]|nr:50S ribosomal protein L25 [Brevinematales bacterium]